MFTVTQTISKDLIPTRASHHVSGSEEERMAVEMASRYGSKPLVYPFPSANDVTIEMGMEGAGPRMGSDARLSVILKNRSSVQRSTTLLCEVKVMYYTGVLKASLKKERVPVTLKPQEGEDHRWFRMCHHRSAP